MLTVRTDLTADEVRVVWTLAAVGRPMIQADLAGHLPQGLDLGGLLLILRRLGLVHGQAPVILTSAGVRCVGRIAKAMDAQQRRELRQLGTHVKTSDPPTRSEVPTGRPHLDRRRRVRLASGQPYPGEPEEPAAARQVRTRGDFGLRLLLGQQAVRDTARGYDQSRDFPHMSDRSSTCLTIFKK